jgi:uncharacterized protein YihD (DUF1040 family)
MRDPKRIDEVINRVKRAWKTYPDLRLGQLLLNVADDKNLYYLEDDELVFLMEDYLKQLSGRV